MGNGSSITVVGGIASQGIPNGTALFTGLFDPNANVILTFDDVCVTQPLQCTGALSGTLAPGTLNATLAAALGVSPATLGGNDQNLFIKFSGISIPVAGGPTWPTGNALGNTNQLQVITPAATVNPLGPVPEPGTLVLLGSGLLFAAKFARRRWAA